MRKCSPLMWIGVNLLAGATICYVVLVINFQAKHSHQPIGSSSGASSLPDTPNSRVTIRVNLREKLTAHKHHVISQLRQSLLQQKVSSKHHTLNQARFFGSQKLRDLTPSTILCNLHSSLEKSKFQTLTSTSNLFPEMNQLLREGPVIQGSYKTCAIVSSSGALLNSQLGEFIDSHDYVVRFNNAPTAGFEADVGNKTSLRILNTQILSKPQFQFDNSSLYQNVTLLVWDPSSRNATLQEWAKNPDFPFVQSFFSRRRRAPDEELFLMDPRGLWDLWTFLSLHSPLPIPPNPPSSGFIGLALTLPHCERVDMIEFVPSIRMTKRCHYYDSLEDVGCTIGDWHPLAAEKLLVLSLDPNNDPTIFDEGYARINGFSSLLPSQC